MRVHWLCILFGHKPEVDPPRITDEELHLGGIYCSRCGKSFIGCEEGV